MTLSAFRRTIKTIVLGLAFLGLGLSSAHAMLTNGKNAINVLGKPDYVSVHNTTQAGFSGVDHSVYDSVNNRLFVADTGNSRVLVYTGANSLTNGQSPTYVLGQTSLTAGASVTTQAGMKAPNGLAYDSANNRLFVTDYSSNRVLVYNTSTITNGMNASYVLGQTSFTASTAATTQAGMNGPMGLAYDSTNKRLFVAEYSNNRVLVFNTTTITSGMNAAYVLGQTSYTTSTAATTQGGLYWPKDVAYDNVNNRLFVADNYNCRVQVFDGSSIATGMTASYVLGQSSFTTRDALTTQSGMRYPNGVFYDSTNNRLFVADNGNNRVLAYNVATITNGMDASNVLGQSSFTTTDALTTQSGLSSPWGGGYDSANNRIFVADTGNNRLLVFDASAVTDGMNASYVLGKSDFTTAAAPVTASAMQVPEAVAYDAKHNRLFVADTGNHRVLVYAGANVLTNGQAATYVLGQPDFTTKASATTQSGMSSPLGVAYDSVRDRLFVADYGNYRVLIFDASTITNGMNASYVLSQASFTTKASAVTQAGTSGPEDIAYNEVSNKLYVADGNNNRVLVFDTSSVSNGMNASYVLGQASFTTNTTGATQSKFSIPFSYMGVACDSAHNRLFVTDAANSRVMVFDTSALSNGMNAAKVLGQTTFTGTSSGTTQAKMSFPMGAIYDANNDRLFVAHSNRLLIYNTSNIVNGMNAANVLGQTTFTASTAGTTQSKFTFSYGGRGAYDPGTHRLFFADNDNGRVLVFEVTQMGNLLKMGYE